MEVKTVPSEDCPEKQKAKRQGRLKAKLEKRADLERQKQADRERKRQQALQFLAVLQEDLLAGGEQKTLDSIDALFQVLDWEKQFFPEPQDPRKRIKEHFAYALPNYKEALRISMENQMAAQGAKT
mgnify:CR=1 FL=1